MKVIKSVVIEEFPGCSIAKIPKAEYLPLRPMTENDKYLDMRKITAEVEVVEGIPFVEAGPDYYRREYIGMTKEAKEALGLLAKAALGGSDLQLMLMQERENFRKYKRRPIKEKFWDLIEECIKKLEIRL